MNDEGYSIRWVTGEQDIRGARAVREEVFVREQGVPLSEELDSLDEHAEHLVALSDLDGAVVATLRLIVGAEEGKVSRVAVARPWRRRGIASQMLALASVRARARGVRRLVLAAQLEAVALYEQAGYAVESEVFQEAGIAHVWMGLTLPA